MKSGKTYQVVELERLSARKRPDLREWLISSGSWPDESYRKPAERGGINIEGLASTAQGELLFGVRGPLPSVSTALLARVKPGTADQPLQLVQWHKLDLSAVPGNASEKERGIRAIERVPDSEYEYVVVIGHTGNNHDRLRVGWWNSRSNFYEDIAELCEGFVAEGAAVIPVGGGRMRIIVVSDLHSKIAALEIAR